LGGASPKTNLTFDDMMNIQKNYAGYLATITEYEVKGTGENIAGIYYLSVPPDEKAKVTSMLKDNLHTS
jgi:polyisoprenyl-teichoic acid--peptidoglycan teichoic acid transferase